MGMTIYKNENGNAFFIILVAVALLGAFTATVMNIERDGGDGSQEQQAIELGRLVQTFGKVRDGVLKLQMVNNCPVEQISFVYDSNNDGNYDSTDDYWNPVSPIKCYLFHPGGAGLNFPQMPKGLDGGLPPVITGLHALEGIGTKNNAELAVIAPDISLEACNEINRNYGAKTKPDGQPVEITGDLDLSTYYTGSWGTVHMIENVSGDNEICVNASSVNGSAVADEYYFIYVLMSR